MSFGSRLVYRFLSRLESDGQQPSVEALTDKFPITSGEAAVILADWQIRQKILTDTALPYLDDTAETDDL